MQGEVAAMGDVDVDIEGQTESKTEGQIREAA